MDQRAGFSASAEVSTRSDDTLGVGCGSGSAASYGKWSSSPSRQGAPSLKPRRHRAKSPLNRLLQPKRRRQPKRRPRKYLPRRKRLPRKRLPRSRLHLRRAFRPRNRLPLRRLRRAVRSLPCRRPRPHPARPPNPQRRRPRPDQRPHRARLHHGARLRYRAPLLPRVRRTPALRSGRNDRPTMKTRCSGSALWWAPASRAS